MSVTADNVIVGIGDFKIDGTSIGSTFGGVTITKEVEIFEKMVDQQLNPVGMNKVRETYRVSTEVAETALAQLKVLWDVPNSVEAGATTNTLSLGTETSVTYKTLEFYGKSPEGYDRKFYVYRAFITEVGDTVLAKDDITRVPITFTIYADTTKPTDSQLGYIEDTTSE